MWSTVKKVSHGKHCQEKSHLARTVKKSLTWQELSRKVSHGKQCQEKSHISRSIKKNFAWHELSRKVSYGKHCQEMSHMASTVNKGLTFQEVSRKPHLARTFSVALTLMLMTSLARSTPFLMTSDTPLCHRSIKFTMLWVTWVNHMDTRALPEHVF